MRRDRGAAVLTLLAAALLAPAVRGAEPAAPDPVVRPAAFEAVTTCLRPAGGGVLSATDRARRGGRVTTALVDGAAPLAAAPEADLGVLLGCPAAAVASGPAGPAIVAAPVARAGRLVIAARARDGGGALGPRTVLDPGTGPLQVGDVATAVAPDGSGVVVWGRDDFRGSFDGPNTYEVHAAVRGADGRWRPSVTLARVTGVPQGTLRVAAAADAAGRLTAAWTLPQDDRPGRVSDIAATQVAQAPAGGAFGRPQTLVPHGQDTERPVLAIARDGHALLAAPHNGAIELFDRDVPDAPWTLRQRLLDERDGPGDLHDPAVAIRDGGGAVVAWTGTGEAHRDALAVMTRDGGGPFRTPVVLADDRSGPADGSGETFDAYRGVLASYDDHGRYPPLDDERASLTTALTAAGRTLLVWETDRGVRTYVGTLTAPGTRSVLLPPGCRLISGAVAFPGADGTPRTAIADDTAAGRFPDRPGALRVVSDPDAARAAADAVAAPDLSVAPPATRERLRVHDPLHVRVTCATDCDVTLAAPDVREPSVGEPPSGGARLRAGRTTTVTLDPGFGGDRLGARVRVRVTACGPGGLATSTRELTIRSTIVPAAPVVPAQHVRARRRADGAVIVTWTTARPAVRTGFVARLSTSRRPAADEPFDGRDSATVPGRARRSFSVVLRPRRTPLRRYATVQAFGSESQRLVAAVVVPIT